MFVRIFCLFVLIAWCFIARLHNSSFFYVIKKAEEILIKGMKVKS